jgi:fructose-1,6-bisphosphatase
MHTKIIAEIAKKMNITPEDKEMREIIKFVQNRLNSIQRLSSETLENKLADQGAKLHQLLNSTIYISDPHGAAEIFKDLFYRRFGLIQILLKELITIDAIDDQELSKKLENWYSAGLVIKDQGVGFQTGPEFSEEAKSNKVKLSETGLKIMAHVIRTGEIPEEVECIIGAKTIMSEKIVAGLDETMLRDFVMTILMKFIIKVTLEHDQFDNLWEKIPEEQKRATEALFRNNIYPSEKDRILNTPEIFAKYLRDISQTARDLVLGKKGKAFVLGDLFDRGGHPDHMVALFNAEKPTKYVEYIWGNHDILWMGAATGNPASAIEALRISFRYDKNGQVTYLDRIGFDYTKLKEFALKTYGKERPQMLAEAKNDDNAVIEKALFVIQSKLKQQMIEKDKNNIYGMQDRLFLNDLAKALESGENKITIGGKEYELRDTNFPTLDRNNPAALTAEEADIVKDLVRQFRDNEKFQETAKFMFNRGQMYNTNHGNLLIHANVPSDGNGNLLAVKAFENKAGKELFDYLNKRIKDIGKKLIKNTIDSDELDIFTYLWEGHDSPLNGRDKMATWERYLLNIPKDNDYKGTPGEEKSLHWEQDMKNPSFREAIFKTFSTKPEEIVCVIHGHTPKDPKKREQIMALDEHGKPIKVNVDVGWIKGFPGHMLLETAKASYLITINNSLKEIDIKKNTFIEMAIEKIIEFPKLLRFGDVKDSWKDRLNYELTYAVWNLRRQANDQQP